jgi:hypothetical protein
MIRPVPRGFVRKSASPGRAPFFGQMPSGRTVPTTARPYFGSASRIVWPPARRLPEHLDRQLLREGRDREREQRRAAHRENVVERVGGGDCTVVARVVDDRREEVEREDERPLVVEPVDSRVVGRCEPDEEVLRFGRDEAGQ